MNDPERSASTIRAVSFDAYGTLVHLDNFSGRVRDELALRGVSASSEIVEVCCLAEMDYYTRHCEEATHQDRLWNLRCKCAGVLMSAFCEHGIDSGLDEAGFYEILMGSLRFVAYPDVLPTLIALDDRGLRRVVVSNWDCELTSVLGELGVVDCFDHVYTSAVCGGSKPDRRLFESALDSLDLLPSEVIHVGDRWDVDVVGAQNAGIQPVLLQRNEAEFTGTGVRIIHSLQELEAVIDGRGT
ncbi:MAG: hypothetical protein COZ05_21925 [Armatimonadetes bacterium CG_4_10_14_3_um_filter_59_10]|nr:MAG: hypothetical protein COZ05_21925 [Armatimonadetes bacterium CG_4_10_14_3_um_filter_59_10]